MAIEDTTGDSRTTLRDNLESIALAVLLVLALRQMVVEAFKIPTGSMAPTLLGVHKEARCPNCGWVFNVGHDKLRDGMAQCPNCLHTWPGAFEACGERLNDPIRFRSPVWLWHEGRCAETGRRIEGTDAANRVDRWGSRIFVNKFIYRLREPRRWEVAVFVYPYQQVRCNSCGWSDTVRSAEILRCPDCGSDDLEAVRRNYIKRLAGLPGEEITVRNGDVYVNGEIARKPPDVQEHLWQHVLDSRFVPLREVMPTWDFRAHEHLWRQNPENGALTLDAFGADRTLEAVFARPIRDLCAYNGGHRPLPGMAAESGRHEVGDRRIEALITVESSRRAPGAAVLLRIVEDDHDFALSVPAGEAGRAVLTDGGTEVRACDVDGLRPCERTLLVLENYDDTVVAKLRGKTIISYPYEGNPEPRVKYHRLGLGAAGAKVAFDRIRIHRDIHYVGGDGPLDPPRTYVLDDESYFVLGDNSPESSDSRAWPDPRVPRDNVLGLAFAVFWPIHDIEFLSRPW